MMSERGKNWRNPEEPPVSVGDRSVDSDRPTLPAPENHKAGEKITEDPVVQESKSEVEDTRASWRKTKILSVAWISMILGSSGTGYYMYENKIGPFSPEDNVVQTAPTSSPEEPLKINAPLKIENEEDLKRAFEKSEIPFATTKDFDFATKKTAHHAKAVVYQPKIAGNKKYGTEDTYGWIEPTDKILTIESDKLLVAVHLLSDYARQNPEKVVNSGPGAHKYVARMTDEKDPNILYFYFDKCTNKKQSSALARIRIQDIGKSEKHLWFQSFNIPKCQIETNGVESDEPIQ